VDRHEWVLAGLAAARGASHTPVQVQKLFFLLDANIAALVDGPYFDFQPYNYGPFDKSVYQDIEALASQGFAELVPERSWLSYRLTDAGQARGLTVLDGLPPEARSYIERVSSFVRSVSFTELVSAIYRAYPHMRARSVFQD
jgi:Uncharacterized conserved protein